MMRGLFACLLAVLLVAAAAAQAKPKTKGHKGTGGFLLSRHLDMAVSIDAQSRTLEAQRSAVSARYATSNSITPGSPYVSGSQRNNTSGNLHDYTETEVEAGMPMWLPGQREAYENSVTAGMREIDEKLALRRLEVAGLVRDAWWSAQRAAQELTIARHRVVTARELGHDMERRVHFGEAAGQDDLLARNETLAAETELSQAEAAVKATRATYAVLTNGGKPEGMLEGATEDGDGDTHPALRVPRSSLARAETESRLAETSFIENPEIGVFGRHEGNNQYDAGQSSANGIKTDSTTVGVRIKVPLPTPGRNEPREAEAAAEVERTHAELDRAERTVAAEAAAARAALAAARRSEALAAKRLAIANEHFELSRKAFSLGEISAFELYRVRQSQLDALHARASLAIDAGVALSRLNQARGYAPAQ